MSESPERVRLALPSFDGRELELIRQVLEDGFLTGGPRVAAFEDRIAAETGCPFAVAVSSGTTAIQLAVTALGIGAGDEVIVPDFTFPATANAVVAAGGVPVPCDVDPVTFNLDASKVPALLTARTRAVMPVHLFGMPAEMGDLLEIARTAGADVIEDAACALGATHRGRRCGAFGRLACFSFHPRKVVTTGEGGAVTTGDERVAHRLRLLRNHGIERRPGGMEFAEPGYNYRLSDVHAAIGIAQLDRLAEILSRRRSVASEYRAALAGIGGVRLPREPDSGEHGWQSFVVSLDPSIDRGRLIEHLSARGIEAVPGGYALHLTRAYAPLRERGGLEVSALLHATTLALPFHQGLTAAQMERVAAALSEFIG